MDFSGATPVLSLHGIRRSRTALEKYLHVPPSRFRNFLRLMRILGYDSIPADELIGGTKCKSPVVLTFDDGYAELHDELLPLLEPFALKPLVFLVAAQIGGTNVWDRGKDLPSAPLLNASEIRTMSAHGVQFGSHAMTHPALPELDDANLRRELTESKDRLEQLLGIPVDWFCYPYGAVDKRVRDAVAEAGYKAAFAGDGLCTGGDPYLLPRITVGGTDTLYSLYVKLRTGSRPEPSKLRKKLSSLKRQLFARRTG